MVKTPREVKVGEVDEGRRAWFLMNRNSRSDIAIVPNCVDSFRNLLFPSASSRHHMNPSPSRRGSFSIQDIVANIQTDEWERQPFESARAYSYFCLYRDTDQLERSVKKVAEKVG